MKAFLAALVTMGVLAYGAAMVLNQNYQSTSAAANTTSGARLGDPGENLVGPNWDGLAKTNG
ncbi:MAG: hypothetical protein COW75_08745 [Rhodobacterales bacterium CG18_big_fil_WC_8_21_14_2_50_71_9]|nr:MAG: hypothetical protein COW75_08745 [Rhodobacterales bacterium CG18_big_fil_WC_8_21_14_2_50_71_9]PJA60195.1 MAG: hypothetical protein CO163_05205 [Rhodobacterales bacterium CG_4_9_14_3_um_filter_71_31]